MVPVPVSGTTVPPPEPVVKRPPELIGSISLARSTQVSIQSIMVLAGQAVVGVQVNCRALFHTAVKLVNGAGAPPYV